MLGGAIWEDDSASLVGTTVEQNSANQGGGIYVFWVLQATDSAFLDNSATGPDSTGGAIVISGTHGIEGASCGPRVRDDLRNTRPTSGPASRTRPARRNRPEGPSATR